MDKDKKLYFLLILIFVISYFLLHCFTGNRGYIRMLDLKDEILHKKHILLKLKEQHSSLKNKIDLISDSSINKDYLEELARDYFGLIEDGEFCIFD